MSVKTKIRFLSLAVFLAALVFTTCNAPMGMGKPIDWEAPVLIMDQVPNPLYVRKGTILTGKATDNIGVDRIVFTNRSTGKELFPVVRNGNNWIIELLFTEEQNGEKITGEIRAYDKMNNSGEKSVALVTMIIDILPPIVDDITIKRTDTRISYLEPLSVLKDYETTDRHGEKKDNIYKYQNGWFYIDSKINDEETTVEIVSLDFYDIREPNTLLFSFPVDEGSTNFFPRWTIKEENIINAGAEKWGADYKTNYYKKDGERYYYRVTVKAFDKSDNESVEEEEGYLCLWAKSDEPKGILDPTIGTIVSRGTPLPIDFFDDDSLLWGYAGLLTEEQWYGTNPIAPGTNIPSTYTDDQKLLWLKERLTGRSGDDVTTGGTAKGPVYNWVYDKHPSYPPEPVTELIKGKSLDEQLVFVSTGKDEDDYGHYVLFTIAADKKFKPHDGNGPEWTNKNIWSGKIWEISVIDENAPLIVFDTVKSETNPAKLYSPEENTFPELKNGEFFNIVGYTLRENATEQNKVTKFRMAWIPYNMPDLPGKPKGADGYIKDVQNALSNDFEGMPAGVQFWDFTEDGVAGTGLFKNEGNEDIDESVYIKQSFVKKLSVLGGADDIKPETRNFMYDYKKADGTPGKDGTLDLENETKLFIFYAVDNMGHEVFRQLRLLGNKTPPALTIYDFSNYLDNDNFSTLPDPNDALYNTAGAFDGTLYYPALNTVNAAKYGTIKSVIGTQNMDGVLIPSLDDITIPFKIYPRGTILKYHIKAEELGVTAVQSISMKDITFSNEGQVVGSAYNSDNCDLTFCEYYPDVTQRTFLFEATDELGNVARVQRTVAVTNAAKLDNITTTTQSGTYGIGQLITLQANFSSQVYVTGGVPHLNIRYERSGSAYYQTIPCSNSPMPNSSDNSTSVLEFNFTVGELYGGKLETLYENAGFATENKRPIILPSGVKIVDSNRGDSAFIPGYASESITMPNWASAKNSLQDRKNITFDGIRPKINSVAVSGKDAVGGNYYFKDGETLEFTLTASEAIRPSGAPVLNYLLSNKTGGTAESNATKFKYQRPGSQTQLVFSLSVSEVNSDGRFSTFSLLQTTGAEIVDNADNRVDASTTGALQNLITPATTIYIKKSIPAAPKVTLTGATTTTVTGNTTGTLESNVNPRLEIAGSTATWNDLEDLIQYSLDGGLSWATYPSAKDGWTTLNGNTLTVNNGSWDLRARYIDRAGNEGTQTKQLIHVNKDFPRLVSITAVQANSTYKQGEKLEFHLEFADMVKTTTGNNAKITVSNRSTIPNNTAGVSPSYEVELTAQPQTALSTTIKFEWTLNGKEMPNGLYISKIEFAGTGAAHTGALQDRFGNYGVNSTTPTNATTITLFTSTDASATYTCNNLNGAGLIVDCIAPVISARVPDVGGVLTAANSKTVTITFNEPVMIGTGKITVRPYGDYKIPAVMENSGSTINGTYVAGFYDIYNSSLITNADKQTLTQSANASSPSMGNLALDERTGQSAGPYIKLTQGLKEGPGFSGDYNNTTPGANGPSIASSTGSPFMVPDTSTKWVLDYRYSIDNANNTQYANTSNVLTAASTTVVPAIRAVLTKAHWRWQEMDLVSSVSITGNTVTINLNEPLLDGLQWGLSFPEGAFTDKAGNKAPAVGTYTDGKVDTTVNSPYWFWSKGVQAPVIRVNRKSFDARTTAWANPTGRAYSVPADLGGPGGWGIGDFNTVYYRIESETPGAALIYATEEGTAANNGSITAAWTGTIANNRTWARPDQVNGATDTTIGDWVLSNLVRRSPGSETAYTVYENGFNTSRSVTASYQGYRSYNRDVTKTTLDGKTLTAFSGFQGSFTYSALQASKNYVIAAAQITNGGTAYTSSKSYEGVFRSVIALKQDSFGGNLGGADRSANPIMVQGSNVKNGMPSISGFPVYDAGESGDNRFVKLFYYASYTAGNNATGNLYWVSTEIVSQWYFLGVGRRASDNAGTGGTHMNQGDVNNYLFSGYGDLSFSRNQR